MHSFSPRSVKGLEKRNTLSHRTNRRLARSHHRPEGSLVKGCCKLIRHARDICRWLDENFVCLAKTWMHSSSNCVTLGGRNCKQKQFNIATLTFGLQNFWQKKQTVKTASHILGAQKQLQKTKLHPSYLSSQQSTSRKLSKLQLSYLVP